MTAHRSNAAAPYAPRNALSAVHEKCCRVCKLCREFENKGLKTVPPKKKHTDSSRLYQFRCTPIKPISAGLRQTWLPRVRSGPKSCRVCKHRQQPENKSLKNRTPKKQTDFPLVAPKTRQRGCKTLPVSYTHLDVYKRQVKTSVLHSTCGPLPPS